MTCFDLVIAGRAEYDRRRMHVDVRVWRTATTAGAYAFMILAGVGGFLLLRIYGEGLHAPAAAGPPVFGAAASEDMADAFVHVLLALLVVTVVARALGGVLQYLRQPPVVGEILAGLLLGPSLLGRVAPDASAYLLPSTVAPYLRMIAQVGVILYMFVVGLELDTAPLRQRAHVALAISHASILLPFLLGSLVAVFIYPSFSTADVPFTVFALFMGVSMSITAFPVLARILTDRRVHTSRMGITALSCAAVDDVTAWCLLAFVMSVVHARTGSILLTVSFTAGYIIVVFVLLRRVMDWVARRYERHEHFPQSAMAIVFGALLLSSLTTEFIGIHAIFGAFLLGAVIPHDSRMARELRHRLEDVVVVLLLPAFFAVTGLRTEISLLSGASEWLVCGGIIVAACVGKFGGTAVAARVTGLTWRDASALGILMNTRGLVELIVLNIGLDLGVISPAVFAMLVLMALVTTFATTPFLDWIIRAEQFDAGTEPAVARLHWPQTNI